MNFTSKRVQLVFEHRSLDPDRRKCRSSSKYSMQHRQFASTLTWRTLRHFLSVILVLEELFDVFSLVEHQIRQRNDFWRAKGWQEWSFLRANQIHRHSDLRVELKSTNVSLFDKQFVSPTKRAYFLVYLITLDVNQRKLQVTISSLTRSSTLHVVRVRFDKNQQENMNWIDTWTNYRFEDLCHRRTIAQTDYSTVWRFLFVSARSNCVRREWCPMTTNHPANRKLDDENYRREMLFRLPDDKRTFRRTEIFSKAKSKFHRRFLLEFLKSNNDFSYHLLENFAFRLTKEMK